MRVATDVGGTFTDFVCLEDGAIRTAKVPTGASPEEGVVAGLGDLDPDAFFHASTVAANALIEGPDPVALVTTEGFRDVLEIQTQARLDVYDLTARKARVPVPRKRRLEVRERIDAGGEVLVEPEGIAEVVSEIRRRDVDAVAVCTLFSHLNPDHEAEIAEALRDAGLTVSASHEVSAEAREYPRTVTTVADAQVKGPVNRYLDRIAAALGDEVPFHLLQSSGGLVPLERYRERPVRGLLSGPVGGVAAAHRLARTLGEERLLTLDVGGTSADLARIGPDGPDRTGEFTFRDLPIRVPSVDVHTLGAGGGSIAGLDPGGALVVGPESAGSDPGPACYGRGGSEPTVTDADLLAGWVAPDRFSGGIDPDPDRARRAVETLAEDAGLEVEATIRGIQRVVETHMAHGARRVTLARGHDPRRHALCTYGGAGPLHAWAVAEELGAGRVLVPPTPGVFSALGLLLAEATVEEVQGVQPTRDPDELQETIEAVVGRAEAAARAIGPELAVEVRLDARYPGQGHALTVEPGDDPVGAFHRAHRDRRGHGHEARPVEFVAVRARCVVDREIPDIPGPTAQRRPDPEGHRDVLWPDGRQKTAVFDRDDLPVGWSRDGPIVVHDPGATCAVPPDWTVTVHETGTLVLEAT